MSAQTIDHATDTALWLAVEEAFEDSECCACNQPAAAILVVEPCGCNAPVCSEHRKAITRTYNFRSRADIEQTCGGCETIVTGIRWERHR